MTKEVTINDLARMVKEGFDETAKKADVDKRFEQVDKRFEQVDKRFEQVDKHLSEIDHQLYDIRSDVSEIRKNFVYRHEFEKLTMNFDDLMARVKYLESKVGIESGK